MVIKNSELTFGGGEYFRNFEALTSGSLLTWAESLTDGLFLFRTNTDVTATPFSGYFMGYVLIKSSNRKIMLFNMLTNESFIITKSSSGSWGAWFRFTGAPEDITNKTTITNTTGTTTILKAVKSGNIVSINFIGKNSAAVAPPSNLVSASLSGMPKPILGMNMATGYTGGSGIIGQMTYSSGDSAQIIMRVVGDTTISANSPISLTITYITSE